MEDEIKIWLNFAETDLGVAKHLNEAYYPNPLPLRNFITLDFGI